MLKFLGLLVKRPQINAKNGMRISNFLQGRGSWLFCIFLLGLVVSSNSAYAKPKIDLLTNSSYINDRDLRCIDDYMGRAGEKNWDENLDASLDHCLVDMKSSAVVSELLNLQFADPKNKSSALGLAISKVRMRYAIAYIFLRGYCQPKSVKICAWNEAIGTRSPSHIIP